MHKPDQIEEMLSTMKASMGEVRLSQEFDQKVRQATLPQRRSGGWMVLYAVAALLVSVVVLWGQGFAWSSIALAVAMPLALVGGVVREAWVKLPPKAL
jgi:hypothetical protein